LIQEVYHARRTPGHIFILTKLTRKNTMIGSKWGITTFEKKIDHVPGRFIWIRYIPNPE